jgi:MFS family permease
VCAFITTYLYRRTQFLSSFVGMLVMFSIWTGVSASYAQHASTAAGTAVVAMIFLYNTMYSIMQPLTYVYVTEVFSYVHRAKGVAVLQFFTRGSTAFNSFVNPIGIDSLQWKFYLVYVVCWCFTYPRVKSY